MVGVFARLITYYVSCLIVLVMCDVWLLPLSCWFIVLGLLWYAIVAWLLFLLVCCCLF